MAKYILEYVDSALEDLELFKKYEQVIILDTIDEQLLYEPDVEVNNRRPMEPNKLATWELRIGVYRVFYDVDQQNRIFTINAIGYKEHNILFLRSKEYIPSSCILKARESHKTLLFIDSTCVSRGYPGMHRWSDP